MWDEAIGKEYVSLTLAGTVASPHKLYANLSRKDLKRDDIFALIWNPTD